MSNAPNSTLIADLDALDALFATEANWKKGQYGFGWIDSDPLYPKTCGCIHGGCYAVTGGPNGDNVRRINLRRTLWNTVQNRSRARWESLEDWNDHRSRRFAQIKKLIAATRARLSSDLP